MQSTPPWKPPRHGLIGHRGAALQVPENTLEGLRYAAKAGLNWIEVDVQLLHSGELVIFHDATLERTSNGTGSLFEHSLKELQLLEAGQWFHTPHPHCRIPSFESLIKECLKLSLEINLELKVTDIRQRKKFIDVFCRQLRYLWPSSRPLPLISSFEWDLLEEVRDYFPTAWLGYLSDTWSPQHESLLFQEYSTLNYYSKAIAPNNLLSLPKNHCPFLIYTVNHPIEALGYLQAGVYGLFTDDAHLQQHLTPPTVY